jgi:hypothetical protein
MSTIKLMDGEEELYILGTLWNKFVSLVVKIMTKRNELNLLSIS